MNDGNGWEHIIDLLILLNADEELINKIKNNCNQKQLQNANATENGCNSKQQVICMLENMSRDDLLELQRDVKERIAKIGLK